MRALLIERSVPRFAAARAAALLGSSAGSLGPLRLVDLEPPALPGPSWCRVRPRLSGICGSDLHTIDGASSRSFEAIVSFPFVLGHELVGDVLDGPLEGARVVLEPVLGCAARAIDPPCGACASGDKGACAQLAFGSLSPGLQTGFCADTGGAFSDQLVAHESQLHVVPETMSDEAAVLVEPTACAIHGALRAAVSDDEVAVVVGAGTLGLLTLAALSAYSPPRTLLASAKHSHQATLARALGADVVAKPLELVRAVRRLTGGLAYEDASGNLERLANGADVVLDCVGSATSLQACLSVVRPGGRIVLVGMPGKVSIDLAPLWQREVELVGAYAYGTETLHGTRRSTFSLALGLVQAADLGRLVSAKYALEHHEEALRHAASAGRRGAVKVVFDLRRATPPRPRALTPAEDQAKERL